MALVIRRVFTQEQKAKRLENLIRLLANGSGPAGRSRAAILTQLQGLGFTIPEIQAAVASITASGEIEVVDDGK